MALKLYDKLRRAVRRWLLRTLPPCREAVQTISQSMERRLTFSEAIKLKLHLWVCAWCQWYMEHLHLIRDTSQAQATAAPEQMTSATLSNEARERIRRRLTNQN
jgi:hypothetical protein